MGMKPRDTKVKCPSCDGRGVYYRSSGRCWGCVQENTIGGCGCETQVRVECDRCDKTGKVSRVGWCCDNCKKVEYGLSYKKVGPGYSSMPNNWDRMSNYSGTKSAIVCGACFNDKEKNETTMGRTFPPCSGRDCDDGYV